MAINTEYFHLKFFMVGWTTANPIARLKICHVVDVLEIINITN